MYIYYLTARRLRRFTLEEFTIYDLFTMGFIYDLSLLPKM